MDASSLLNVPVDADSDNVIFFNDDTDIVNVGFNNFKIHDDNFDDDEEGDPKTIIHIRLMAWCNRYKQRKAYTKRLAKNQCL